MTMTFPHHEEHHDETGQTAEQPPLREQRTRVVLGHRTIPNGRFPKRGRFQVIVVELGWVMVALTFDDGGAHCQSFYGWINQSIKA